MDIQKFLAEATRLPGTPGFEAGVNEYIRRAVAPCADEAYIDKMENVVARIGSEGPRVMISAHQDEIGLVITRVEDDGCLRFTMNGGVDPRILPTNEVRVIAKGGDLFGVIGAKPPQLLRPGEKDKPVKMEDLYIDIGYPAEEAKALVRVGDPAVFSAPFTALANRRFAGKTMDDRACVAAMIACGELLKQLRPKAQVYLVASTQEEIGAVGAETAAYALNPDFAIAIDVTHGEGPGTDKWEAFDLDKVCLTCGPTLHKGLEKRMCAVADKWHIPYSMEVSGRYTGTDADEIHRKRAGVPCALVSVPLRYMHTSVETLCEDAIRDAGRLMALFIDDMAREWEAWKWY